MPFLDVDPPPDALTFSDPFAPSLVWVDHITEGLDKLLEVFKGKPNIAALLSTWLGKVQEVENTLWALKLLRGLLTSTGAQLDTIGDTIGEPDRAGDTDDDYRLRILARISVNLSNGRRDDMLSVLGFLLGDTFPVQAIDYPPACVLYAIVGLTAVDPLKLYRIMFATKAGGVRLFLVWSDTEGADVFTGDSVYATVTVSGQYPGTVYDGSLGGVCASVIG